MNQMRAEVPSVPAQEPVEGGCPKGTYDVGAGYCRTIVCKGPRWVRQDCIYAGSSNGGDCSYSAPASTDRDAQDTLTKYGKSCPFATGVQWGDTNIPKR